MRVDRAIHPVACGNTARASGASARPAVVTMARESPVAIDMPFLS